MAGGAIIGAGIGALGNIIGVERQNRATEKFMGIQKENQKELNQQGADLQYDMWKKTNYPAQLGMMKEAGLSAGLMYGGSGAGGATTGSQSGGSAASGGQGAKLDIGSNVAQMAQIALLKAQKDNIEADTVAKKTGAAYQSGPQTAQTEADTKTKEEQATKTREEGKSVYLDNIVKQYERGGIGENEVNRHTKYGDGTIHEGSAKTRTIEAQTSNIEQQLELAKKENNIKQAETIIKNFEASMAEQGISTNSPYYVKLLTDILNKLGIIEWIKGK